MLKNKEISPIYSDDSGLSGMNEAGTDLKIDKQLTRPRSPTVPEKGFVYFIRAGDFIKIGFSDDPRKRLAALQSAHPHLLEMIGFMPGTMDDEYRIHCIFGLLHVRGEWFNDDPSIREFLRKTKGRKRQLQPRQEILPAMQHHRRGHRKMVERKIS